MSDSLQTHGLQHTRPPCPSPTPRVYSNPCPLSRWCHPTISSSVVPFSHLQSFPASGSFQMSQFFASGGQSIGVSDSASVFSTNIQDWCPLGWTGWISLQSKGLSRLYDPAIPRLSIYPKKMKSLKRYVYSNVHNIIYSQYMKSPKVFIKRWMKYMCCMCMYVPAYVCALNHVQLFAIPWTAACEAPLSMED